MGTMRTPASVKLICGCIFSTQDVLQHAVERLQVRLGRIDLHSDIFPFIHTDYYSQEMGSDLSRLFVAFQRLIRCEQLPEIKILTNGLEENLALTSAGRLKRRINIDPGYLEASKLVLASTKNFSHRIYLGRGIYGEVTLQYRANRFEPLPWTYPDYRELHVIDFLKRARRAYMEQIGQA
jgi:hypothetical protein